MKILMFVLALVSTITHADLNKCAKDGRFSYQELPCDRSSSVAEIRTDTAGESMIGCYGFKYRESSGEKDVIAEIKNASGGGLEMSGFIGDKTRGVRMKRATYEEVQTVARNFRLDLRQGVSMKWVKDPTTNQPPLGFYKGKDDKGNDVILVYFALINAKAKRIPCP
ncbi:MAG: hypothetical protein IH605_15405 [Burkholderiales bacterium]|nr:hypothetical protein [Burkholderiales bacterium]